MRYILFGIVFLTIYILSVTIVRKKFNIETKWIYRYKRVNKVHMWGEMLIIGIFLILVIFSSIISSEYYLYYYSITFALLYGFRGYMERKHRKENKEYILNFMAMGFFILLPIGMKIFKL